MDHVVAETAANTGLTLVLALNYGARDELVDAVRRLAEEVRGGARDPGEIDEAAVSRALYTDGIPDPDLLIRTSGEMRLSNFFLWQLAYTEIYVSKSMWPEFREREYLQALDFFQQRQRRFGRTSAQVERERLERERLRAVF